MKTNIPERIAALREAMKQHKIDAYIIPTSDPHMSEYPADCWKYREWISGFIGNHTVCCHADISCKPLPNWKGQVSNFSK